MSRKHRHFSLGSLISGRDNPAEAEAEISRVYGRDENGNPNITEAAEGYGVTARTVKSWMTPKEPSVADQLGKVYGHTARGGLDTRRAAEDLGVSRRTVQRWAKTGKLPASPSGQAAAASMTAWQDSPAGRRQRMGEARIKRLSKGFKTRTTGTFTISSDRRGRRDVRIDVEANEAQAIVDAYLRGDDAGMRAAYNEAASQGFGGSVDVTISSIRFD